MMKRKATVKIGDHVCSDEGDGEVLAITKQFIIIEAGCSVESMEICLSIEESHIWISIDELIQGGKSRTVQIDTDE